jgi:tetratricopeptide (TPR) repeat protein
MARPSAFEGDHKMNRFTWCMRAALAVAMALPPAVHAADTPEPAPVAEPPAANPLVVARAQIKAQQWDKAVAELQRVGLQKDADWNNLMGFAQRKKASPDLAAAQRYYDAALRIKPDHRGALEYAGELDLMKGDLPRAEQRLAALAKACPSGCEEFDDLKGEIARFKANGNKYVAKP